MGIHFAFKKLLKATKIVGYVHKNTLCKAFVGHDQIVEILENHNHDKITKYLF